MKRQTLEDYLSMKRMDQLCTKKWIMSQYLENISCSNLWETNLAPPLGQHIFVFKEVFLYANGQALQHSLNTENYNLIRVQRAEKSSESSCYIYISVFWATYPTILKSESIIGHSARFSYDLSPPYNLYWCSKILTVI